MFLSKAAITKQLFYEFLDFETLALAPGKPVEMRAGTLLGSSLSTDPSVALGLIETRLKNNLGKQGNEAENKKFSELLSALMTYKKAAGTADNPFAKYAESSAVTGAHPCAWPIFAPLLMDSAGSTLTYDTEERFINYLKKPKVGFHFNTNASIDKTGLFIAVRTNNHEMVNAFLCPEFNSEFSLSKADLKKLLALTDDPQTRMVLFRHSKNLIQWIRADSDLQKDCIKSFAELTALWSYLTEEQRKDFIKYTNSKLWLNFLDKELSSQKIEQLLGADFALLNTKLLQDIEIKTQDLLPKNIQYLKNNQQFDYLLNRTDLNRLFRLPRSTEWNNLLESLGYKRVMDGSLTTTRYILPEVVARVHDNLVNALISLPVEAAVIVEALEKVEAYVHSPDTILEYKDFLQRIAKDVVTKEYETGFFITNWINKLLRFLNIKSESPLHPYIDRLTRVAQESKLEVAPGELMQILAPVADYKIYKESISAYFAHNIKEFWAKLPPTDRERIIHDPFRFEILVNFLSQPKDHRDDFFKALDEDSLQYFNTPTGIRQLLSQTPSFIATTHLPILIETMKDFDIKFLDDVPSIVELLLVEEKELLSHLVTFFPYRSNTPDDLSFQESVLMALPKPLQKEHLNCFLQVYCPSAHHFSDLLLTIIKDNPLLVSNCWDNVSEETWARWYAGVEYAEPWAQTLKHLALTDRLEFFEKLTSGERLEPEEFCDFLLAKNEAVFQMLWNKVPKQQWDSWIKTKLLPATTVSLLETMSYPLRVDFFRSMLKMKPAELADLCITPGKTIEQFYPQEVAAKIANATTPSDVKAKLVKLKEDKRTEFDEGLVNLTAMVKSLDEELKAVRKIDLNAHNGIGRAYIASFFKTDPYYALVGSIRTAQASVDKLHKQILHHPILPVASSDPKVQAGFVNLGKELAIIKEHLQFFQSNSSKMADNLKQAIAGIEASVKEIEKMDLVPKIAEGTVDLQQISASM